MTAEEILAEKRETLLKACNHIETDYIPNVAFCGNGILAHAGVTYHDVVNDEAKIEHVFRKLLSVAHFDVGMLNFSGSPQTYAALDGRTETFLAPDGIGLQHIQKPTMKEDEYPQLIEDIDKFMKEVLLPRKFPELFADKERALEKLKIVVGETVARTTGPYSKVHAKICAEYGFVPFPLGLPRFVAPADWIFDRFRGFKGTLTDMKRHPEEFKKAIDVIYKKFANLYKNVTVKDHFASYMPHIPCYMNMEQFRTFFWPYFRELVTNIANSGNKVYMSLEGRWLPFIEHFLELPKDSVIIMVDDDDILELKKRIGHHQVLTGGVKIQNTRLLSKEENIDYAKRVIDACAPGGGFMFNSDKMWIFSGDINQNLIDVYNFAHEYGKK